MAARKTSKKTSRRASRKTSKKTSRRASRKTMTVAQLRAKCKKMGITGYSTMNKAELMKACNKKPGFQRCGCKKLKAGKKVINGKSTQLYRVQGSTKKFYLAKTKDGSTRRRYISKPGSKPVKNFKRCGCERIKAGKRMVAGKSKQLYRLKGSDKKFYIAKTQDGSTRRRYV